MSSNYEAKLMIARHAARELNDGDTVNLGIGLPTLVKNYVNPKYKITLQSENGYIGLAPADPKSPESPYIVDAGGTPSGIEDDGAFFNSSISFAMMRGGHVDCTVIGALQVSETGDIASWIVPGKSIAGMGGAMDLVIGAKKVIVAMLHTNNGEKKILKTCTLPLTAKKKVQRIITDMAVMDVVPEGLLLKDYNPAYTIEEIQAVTEPKLILWDGLAERIRTWYPDGRW